MFYGAYSFNQDIRGWDVSNVINMERMFDEAFSFNQDIGGWNVSNVTNMHNMFSATELSIENYNSLLLGWSQLNLQSNVVFGAGYSQYNYGAPADARQSIIDNFNWTITDGGMVPVTATIATTAITEITEHTALSGGNITSEGGSAVTERGIVWSTRMTLI